jgi:hypothetical protein
MCFHPESAQSSGQNYISAFEPSSYQTFKTTASRRTSNAAHVTRSRDRNAIASIRHDVKSDRRSSAAETCELVQVVFREPHTNSVTPRQRIEETRLKHGTRCVTSENHFLKFQTGISNHRSKKKSKQPSVKPGHTEVYCVNARFCCCFTATRLASYLGTHTGCGTNETQRKFTRCYFDTADCRVSLRPKKENTKSQLRRRQQHSLFRARSPLTGSARSRCRQQSLPVNNQARPAPLIAERPSRDPTFRAAKSIVVRPPRARTQASRRSVHTSSSAAFDAARGRRTAVAGKRDSGKRRHSGAVRRQPLDVAAAHVRVATRIFNEATVRAAAS